MSGKRQFTITDDPLTVKAAIDAATECRGFVSMNPATWRRLVDLTDKAKGQVSFDPFGTVMAAAHLGPPVMMDTELADNVLEVCPFSEAEPPPAG